MDFLLIVLQPHVMVFIALAVVFCALRPGWRARERSKGLAEQTPALTDLAQSLGGTLLGPGQAAAWSPRLARSRAKAELSLDFRRGVWHVRVTEACDSKPLFTDNLLVHEHWIEVATVPLPPRTVRLEFFSLSFEDGFVHTVCQGRVRPDELVHLVDVVLEALDRMSGVEPRDPSV
jgi:hypothetical protein